ncbi:MAG TPA: RNA polymerase sigma factor [Vicinamibacterales bacterium]|jgi:RNA polymerase sigma-70 factor (ECF subfamily)|nr:RNA polymerase sigma factor [Vicinamibacterales bacterium]
MHDHADVLAGALVGVDQDLEREFEVRLLESSTLAFRVAFGVLRHRQDAEDVAQEALAKAYRNFRQLRDRNRFRSWLVRMTWRLAIDRQRSDRRRALREFTHGDVPSTQTTADTLVSRERTAEIWRAIDGLSDKLRVVVVLAGIEGHDIREIAKLLGLPEGTVKSRLFLARRRLREQLQ